MGHACLANFQAWVSITPESIRCGTDLEDNISIFFFPKEEEQILIQGFDICYFAFLGIDSWMTRSTKIF